MCREMILTGGGALAVNGNVLSTVLAKSNYAMMIIISFYKIMVLVCRLLNLMNPH